MAAAITRASSAPKKSANRDAEMIHFRLLGVIALDEVVAAVVFNRFESKKSFKF
jgi:hypothetical protein